MVGVKTFKIGVCVTVAFFVFGAGVVSAFADEAVTIVIRKGKAKIVAPDGTEKDVPESDMTFRNKTNATPNAAKPSKPKAKVVEPATDETPETPADEAGTESAPDGEKTPETAESTGKSDPATGPAVDENKDTTPAKGEKPTVAAAKPVKKEKSKAQVEAEKKATDDIARMRATGGAYFFDKNDKPLTGDEVDQMIKEGKIGELKATTLHQETWEPKIPEDDEDAPAAKPEKKKASYNSSN